MTHLMIHVKTPDGPIVVEGEIENGYECEFAHGRFNLNAVASCVRLEYPVERMADGTSFVQRLQVLEHQTKGDL